MESMIKARDADKTEVNEKRKSEGILKFEKKGIFSNTGPKKKKPRGNFEARWFYKCKKKHLGRYGGEVTCYKWRRASHYSRDCIFNEKKCYECGGNGHIFKNCTKKNKSVRSNVQLKAKARAYHMILEEEKRGQEFGVACQECLKEGDE